jgi:hypothetical protein
MSIATLSSNVANGSLGGWSPLTWALSWVTAGYLAIPLEHGTNRPHRLLLGKGWSARAGTAGSRDPEQIMAWWQVDPGANIGIVTAVSPLSRVLIIDVDTKPGKPNGWESISDLVKEYEPLPETTRVITPSGGMHLYYAMPEGEPPVRCRTGWLSSVDIPWLVPVPPSAKLIMQEAEPDTAEDYVSYQWARIVDPLPVAPAWLLADIRNRRASTETHPARVDTRNRRKQPQGPIGTGRSHGHSASELPSTEWFLENGFRPGQRNEDCHRVACRLWYHHWPNDDQVHSVLCEIWQRTEQSVDPFTWSEAMSCIDSARRFVGPKIEARLAWINQLRAGS